MAVKKSIKPAPRDTSNKSVKANSPSTEQPKRSLDQTLRSLNLFQRFFWDILGIAALVLAITTLFALITPELTRGFLITWWIEHLRDFFGWGSIWIVVLLSLLGFWLLRRRTSGASDRIPWGRIILFEVAVFSSIAILTVLGGSRLQPEELSQTGGRVGWGLAEMLRMVLSPIGLDGTIWMALLLMVVFVLSLMLAVGFLSYLYRWARRSVRATALSQDDLEQGVIISEAPIGAADTHAESRSDGRKRKTQLPAEFRKSFQYDPEEDQKPAEQRERDERLPALDLLSSEQSSRPDERNINLTAGMIEKTLAEFGIPAKVVGFRVGPTVTQFAVEPGFMDKSVIDGEAKQKVRVAQIASLSRDLALALSADRLRIEAPVPGRPYVGIEVPNSRSAMVRLRPILESDAFNKINSPLAIALGRDVSGSPVVADLARMPHLLIAGTTGSGKSVCIAAITACLVMNNTPEDLRLVMADPKMVELVRFNGLPHLYGKVETEIERIMGVLRWTVAEMDRRYKLLEVSRSRNIDSYNRKVRRRKGEQPLPQIVVLVDELADMMMTSPDQTEHNLVRLAQMARATGIHLVVATQRPSTDVVTGLIKANFPARISFAMASSIDFACNPG